MSHRLAGLIHVLSALCWSFALAVLGLELLVRLDPLSAVFLDALDVPARVPGAMDLHRGVMGFLVSGTPLPGGFGAKEARHFTDVAALLASLRLAGLAAVGLAGLLALTRKVRGGEPQTWLRDLRLGALLLPALLTGLALAALEWPLFFTAFHPLLFPGGGYSFNPHVHLIVRLYPKDYFAWMAATLVAVTGLLALTALLAARLRAGPVEKARWRPAQTGWPALGAGLLLSFPAYIAGQHSLTPLSPLFVGYYLVSAALVAGSTLLWATRSKGLGLAVILAALLVYGGLDLGLRRTHAQAMATMRGGDLLVTAIEAHKQGTGDYPPRLEALVPARLPFLPPVLVEGSQWKYQPRKDRFFLGFVGPLGYHFQYASHRGRWKWLEL